MERKRRDLIEGYEEETLGMAFPELFSKASNKEACVYQIW